MTRPEATATGEAGAPVVEAAATPEPTTTITGTTTSTRYITVSNIKTVRPEASGSVNVNEAAAVSGGNAGSEACIPVTVTLPQMTVTVVCFQNKM